MHPPSSVYLDPSAPAPVWAALVAVAVFFLAAFASVVVLPPPTAHPQPAAAANVPGRTAS